MNLVEFAITISITPDWLQWLWLLYNDNFGYSGLVLDWLKRVVTCLVA